MAKNISARAWGSISARAKGLFVPGKQWCLGFKKAPAAPLLLVAFSSAQGVAPKELEICSPPVCQPMPCVFGGVGGEDRSPPN
jgi:hypothetical protein